MTEQKQYKAYQKLIFVIISALIYFLLKTVIDNTQLAEQFMGLKTSAVFPVTAGLLMGPYGALGCGIGNVFAGGLDDLSYFSASEFITSFLFAYLPYKLWHTILPVKGDRFSANSVIKYLLIASFSVFSSMAVCSSFIQIAGELSFSDMMIESIIYNYVYTVFLGTTVFLAIVNFTKIKQYIPSKRYSYEYVHKRYIPDYILVAVIIVLIAVNYILSQNSLADNGVINVLSALIILCNALLVLLPFRRSRKKVEFDLDKFEFKPTLQKHIVFFFFIISTVYLFISSYYSFVDALDEIQLSAADSSQILVTFFADDFIVSVLFEIALVILLKVFEFRFVNPITKVTDYAEGLIASDFKAEKPIIKRPDYEIENLQNSLEKMSGDIIEYISEKEEQIKREEKEKKNLEFAQNIQEGILPQQEILNEHFETSSFIKPAQTMGGDFYDHIMLDENRLLVCIADVSSKGLPAAMFMSEASVIVKCFKDYPPNLMLEKINNLLYETNKEKMFVTMFLGIIDFKEKVFTFSNAGHNYPLLNINGKFEWLKTDPDPFLAMLSNLKYEIHTIKFENSIELFLYTDGVNEAENDQEEFFGDERIENILNSRGFSDLSPGQKLSKMKNSLKNFTGGAIQSDDITMVFIKAK